MASSAKISELLIVEAIWSVIVIGKRRLLRFWSLTHNQKMCLFRTNPVLIPSSYLLLTLICTSLCWLTLIERVVSVVHLTSQWLYWLFELGSIHKFDVIFYFIIVLKWQIFTISHSKQHILFVSWNSKSIHYPCYDEAD